MPLGRWNVWGQRVLFLCGVDPPATDKALQHRKKEQFKWLPKYTTSGNSHPRRRVGIWETCGYLRNLWVCACLWDFSVAQYGCELGGAEVWMMKQHLTWKAQGKNKGRKLIVKYSINRRKMMTWKVLWVFSLMNSNTAQDWKSEEVKLYSLCLFF